MGGLMKRNVLIASLAIVVAFVLAGCGGDDSTEVDVSMHDNWVYLQPQLGNAQLSFVFSEHSVTGGQPWGGVQASIQDGNLNIDVRAGRHASGGVAEWFRSHASAATCANWPSGCPDWPAGLNFAITGTITINGTAYPVTIGQGSVPPHNNWWIGGPGWIQHSTVLGDAVVTPDGKYYFEPIDDTFDQFWIRTSY
jgi:hypothetical protein